MGVVQADVAAASAADAAVQVVVVVVPEVPLVIDVLIGQHEHKPGNAAKKWKTQYSDGFN